MEYLDTIERNDIKNIFYSPNRKWKAVIRCIPKENIIEEKIIIVDARKEEQIRECPQPSI